LLALGKKIRRAVATLKKKLGCFCKSKGCYKNKIKKQAAPLWEKKKLAKLGDQKKKLGICYAIKEKGYF
jgi:hypothetical protein